MVENRGLRQTRAAGGHGMAIVKKKLILSLTIAAIGYTNNSNTVEAKMTIFDTASCYAQKDTLQPNGEKGTMEEVRDNKRRKKRKR